MKLLMVLDTKPSLRSMFTRADAHEALRPYEEHCFPVGGVEALNSKRRRCKCDRCHINRRIRKGLVRLYGKIREEPEKIPSIRFGPGLLVELAGLVKLSFPFVGVALVLAAPMFAAELRNRPKPQNVHVIFRREVVRKYSAVDAAYRPTVVEKPKVNKETPPKELVKVPEVINVKVPSPPTNLRAVYP